MSLKTRKKKNKWILPTAKRVGVLPVLPLLGILRSLVGGAAEVVKAVNDNKVSCKNCNVIIAPWKAAAFISLSTSVDKISRVETKHVEMLKIPKGVTTDVQLQ